VSANRKKWWSRTLATAVSGEAVKVESILSEPVRDSLLGKGIQAGSVLRCLQNRPTSILVEMPHGGKEQVPRDQAWFVSILD
jgi:hypothetical protein